MDPVSSGNATTRTSRTSVDDSLLRRQQKADVGSLLICNEDNTPIGIFTERDYLSRIALQGRSSRTTPVEDAMSANLIFVDPDTGTDECMQLMSHHRIRHIPVVEGGTTVVGLLSMGDLVQDLVSEQRSEIRALTHYIQGQYG